MQLYDEAVDLSLSYDIDKAKEQAEKPEGDEEMRKKLWLRIARHVVEENRDIKQATIFLQQSRDLLKIEDILPFFPDFVQIDAFKEEICQSLREYNNHIEKLELEMKEAAEIAKRIRENIESQRNKYRYVDSKQLCELCKFPILSKPFYIFPCQHVFHCSCLSNEMKQHLLEEKAEEIDHINKAIQEIEENQESKQISLDEDTIQDQLSKLKDTLDKMIAYECYLCGDIMISSITKPFIDDDGSSWII